MRDMRRDWLFTPDGVCHVQMGHVEGFSVWASKPGLCLLVCGAQVWSSEAVVDDEGEGHAGPRRWTWGAGQSHVRSGAMWHGGRQLW